MYSNGAHIAGQQQFQPQFWNTQSEGGEEIVPIIGQHTFCAGNGNNAIVQIDNGQPMDRRIGTMKRAFEENQKVEERRGETVEEEKENHQPKAKRIHLASAESAENDEEEEKEEEEEEEEESSRTTKSSSSAENEEPSDCYSTSAMHQQHQSHHSPNLMPTPHQRTQSTPTSIGNPLAHSTPYLGPLSLNSFPQQQLDFWGSMTFQQMSSHLALVAPNKNIAAGGAFVPSHAPLGQLTPSSSAYYSNLYGQQQQQNFMAPYGGETANGEGGAFSHLTQQGYHHHFLQHSSTNSTYQSRDSDVGSVKIEQKAEEGRNNETRSSTSGGSDESGSSGSAIGRNWMGMAETKFPPFFHMTTNGQQIDLEAIEFGKVSPRLALLNCTIKHSVTLAEIYRRLSLPEQLNTSYLSGILRKAKNVNAGKALRDKLHSYGLGIDLKTGRRKQSSVTTFTTLCEREAIRMADDFAKLASESFPTEQIALEMNRRAVVMCPKDARQRFADVQNASQILQEAIRILQQGIENETLPFPKSDSLAMERTLDNGVKTFSRLSHCFGNRTVMVAWKTLLNVFEKCEVSLGASLSEVGTLPGTSKISEQQQNG